MSDSLKHTFHPQIVDNMPSLTDIDHDQAFENTSTSVAASQMRNSLNTLADTVKDPEEKKVSPQKKLDCRRTDFDILC